MADAGLDFAFAIGIAHPTGQRDRSRVSQHVAIERVEGRIVEVGLQDPFAQIVEVMCPTRICARPNATTDEEAVGGSERAT